MKDKKSRKIVQTLTKNYEKKSKPVVQRLVKQNG